MAERADQPNADLGKVRFTLDADKTVVPTAGVIGKIAPYERKAGNWINAYMGYTKECESPDNYHLWCAFSSISAVMKRNLWLDQGIYLLFPNIYVALVGPPGRTAKSTALYMSRQLLAQIPSIRMGPDSCTREQLIKAMEEQKLNNQCAMTIYSTEFSSLIGPSGVMMIQFLMDIYDCNYTDPKKGWEYATKHQGENKLVNPYMSGLFCTTPTYLAESLPDNLVGHGFTSRVIFVSEDKERQINSRPKANDMELAKALIDDLRHIGHLSGEFKWADDAATKAYDDFYAELFNSVPEDHRLEGYHWRKKIHVLKIAMVLSVAENDSLLISKRDIDTAVQFLHDLEQKMARVFSAVGKYDYAADTERIGTLIRNKGGMSTKEINSRFYHMGGDELKKSLQLLCAMGTVRIVKRDNEDYYVPTSRTLPWG